jgi:DNA-binding response OmpR family regulator
VKILIIEGHKTLCSAIRDYLRQEGHICESAVTSGRAVRKAVDNSYDCIVLDTVLPDGDGLDIIRDLRAKKFTDGILILSSRNSLEDKLDGLNAGADDYLTKPFHFAELGARINSIYRRNNLFGLNEVTFNEIKVNTAGNQVYISDKSITLTRKEYDLLLYFVANNRKVITKESIVERLWGDNTILTNSFDFIYTHVKNLRKKIVEAGGRDYIKSIYGFGYQFTDG